MHRQFGAKEVQVVKNSRQSWQVGAAVKVGFLALVVKATIATPGDGAPDAYILANAAGTQLYKFVPHNGVEKISPVEAQALMAGAEEAAARATYRALHKASLDAKAAAAIGKIFEVAA